MTRSYTLEIPLKAPPSRRVAKLYSCGAIPTAGSGAGDLRVVINGLPSGTSGDVTISGPDASMPTTISSTSDFRDLTVGGYQVTARDVWSDTWTAWHPSITNPNPQVTAFSPSTTTVTYTKVKGNLSINVQGCIPA